MTLWSHWKDLNYFVDVFHLWFHFHNSVSTQNSNSCVAKFFFTKQKWNSSRFDSDMTHHVTFQLQGSHALSHIVLYMRTWVTKLASCFTEDFKVVVETINVLGNCLWGHTSAEKWGHCLIVRLSATGGVDLFWPLILRHFHMGITFQTQNLHPRFIPSTVVL